MRVYIGFDDTDTLESGFGTGKLARKFRKLLPEGCRLWGVIRQQLLINENIPYTSHNSSACVIVDCTDPSLQETLYSLAVHHIEYESAQGSDPGLCIVSEGSPSLGELMNFGYLCTRKIVTQREALGAASAVHISGHGGSNDGIIGAAAAVGLTATGWNGRFIEFNRLRSIPDPVSVSELDCTGIRVVNLDRDSPVAAPDDLIYTKGWLRPRLWGGQPVLPIVSRGENRWESIGEKRKKL